MPVFRVDNQQSPIPRPLLVVKTRNKGRSSSKKKGWPIRRREIHAVKAITPDLLWSYIKERETGRNPFTKKPVLLGLKYAILWPNQWPEWLHQRVKAEDLAAKLMGIRLEPAWTQAIAHQLVDMDRRANDRWRWDRDEDLPPASRVRNQAEDLIRY